MKHLKPIAVLLLALSLALPAFAAPTAAQKKAELEKKMAQAKCESKKQKHLNVQGGERNNYILAYMYIYICIYINVILYNILK